MKERFPLFWFSKVWMLLVKVAILNVLEKLDPTGYEVNGISAPTDVELKHHYLWRFAKKMQNQVI